MKTKEITRMLSDVLFPPRCVGCDEVLALSHRKLGFCPYCHPRIHPVKEPLCKKCGKPLLSQEAEYCYDCRDKQHHYLQGRGVYLYDGPMKKAMYRLKYSNRRAYARVIARDAMRFHGAWLRGIRPEAIVPVPVHPNKMRLRGYNQAEVLAKALGQEMNLPVVNLVQRVADTLPQKEMSAEKRAKNLKNAFKVAKNGVKFKRILIIDDIYTTGATVDAITDVLNDWGIEEVYCLYGCIGHGY
ncbi:MAG: ComF family protein [Lachnospiraceae bacterium]|nr:ComF family protein [Lachnospiraceae bacterium]